MNTLELILEWDDETEFIVAKRRDEDGRFDLILLECGHIHKVRTYKYREFVKQLPTRGCNRCSEMRTAISVVEEARQNGTLACVLPRALTDPTDNRSPYEPGIPFIRYVYDALVWLVWDESWTTLALLTTLDDSQPATIYRHQLKEVFSNHHA